jgi:hypothetical protein
MPAPTSQRLTPLTRCDIGSHHNPRQLHHLGSQVAITIAPPTPMTMLSASLASRSPRSRTSSDMLVRHAPASSVPAI